MAEFQLNLYYVAMTLSFSTEPEKHHAKGAKANAQFWKTIIHNPTFWFDIMLRRNEPELVDRVLRSYRLLQKYIFHSRTKFAGMDYNELLKLPALHLSDDFTDLHMKPEYVFVEPEITGLIDMIERHKEVTKAMIEREENNTANFVLTEANKKFIDQMNYKSDAFIFVVRYQSKNDECIEALRRGILYERPFYKQCENKPPPYKAKEEALYGNQEIAFRHCPEFRGKPFMEIVCAGFGSYFDEIGGVAKFLHVYSNEEIIIAMTLAHNYFRKRRNGECEKFHKNNCYLVYPSKMNCANCAKVETTENLFQQCAQCKSVVYCSRECQLAHWRSSHKKVCKKVAEAEKEGGSGESSLVKKCMTKTAKFEAKRWTKNKQIKKFLSKKLQVYVKELIDWYFKDLIEEKLPILTTLNFFDEEMPWTKLVLEHTMSSLVQVVETSPKEYLSREGFDAMMLELNVNHHDIELNGLDHAIFAIHAVILTFLKTKRNPEYFKGREKGFRMLPRNDWNEKNLRWMREIDILRELENESLKKK